MRRNTSHKRTPLGPKPEDKKQSPSPNRGTAAADNLNTREDSSLGISKQKSKTKRAAQNLSHATLDNLKAIKPDEWNNIALPVTEAIKILSNEVAIMNSRINHNTKDFED